MAEQKHTQNTDTPMRVLVSGGGTGGHIFPALAIAKALQKRCPDIQLHFVGAQGRMEMTRVPAAGYSIEGLPVAGIDRKNPLKNLIVIAKLLKSFWAARSIIRRWRPQVVVGVGGYASAPTLQMAAWMGIPTLIQEQNSYAGVTNRILGRSAKCICVAYEGMQRFFSKDKIVLTGNPVREELVHAKARLVRDEAVAAMGLDPTKPVILVLGGSLGARSINEGMMAGMHLIPQADVQVIWQTGKYYHGQIVQRLAENTPIPMLQVKDFIPDMGLAYAAADLVVSRAGAGSISELCLLEKPAILIPSPNVAEDHQTKNAQALTDRGAALFLADKEAAAGKLLPLAIETVKDHELLKKLSEQIRQMAKPEAAHEIAALVYSLAENEMKS